MELTTVGAALEIVNKAWRALEAIRERAQTSKDAALKANIGELYDEFLALKAIVVRLTDENAALYRAQAEKPPKPEIRQVGETNYYFVGDQGPYCQPCYDCNGKLVNLMPKHRYAGGTGRKCRVCNNVFFEVHESPKQRIIVKHSPWI
jgi:hypothetical protein